jgi:hypothetical protein
MYEVALCIYNVAGNAKVRRQPTAWQAKSFSTASNVARGFSRWLQKAMITKVKTIVLQVLDGDRMVDREWSVLPPLQLALKLKAARPALFFGPSPTERADFWSKCGASEG